MLNPLGIVDFLTKLGEARHILISEFGQSTPLYDVDNPYVIIPEVGGWLWTDRERQIDSRTDSRLTGRSFSFKVRFFGQLLQLYPKFLNGKGFLRLEGRACCSEDQGSNVGYYAP